MIKVREGESFKCEGCKKEWKALFIIQGTGTKSFVCGNEEMAKEVPAWSGCGHVNKVQVVR